MADIPRIGAFSYIQYGIEDSAYGTEAGTRDSAFGHDISITIDRRNNMIESRGLGDRNVQALIAGQFEGMATVEGIMGTTHWLATFWGASSTVTGTPDTHTYAESDTLPSITIENGVDLGTTDSVTKLLGCKLNEVALTCAINEPIRFRATFFYKTETEGTSLDSTPATDADEPFNFAQASVELPDGTTLERVQRLELTLTNNLIRSFGLGSRFLSKLIPGNRSYKFTMDTTFEAASDLLEVFYGSSTAPAATVATKSVDINITNGLANDNERHLQIQLGDVKLDTQSLPQTAGEQIVETVSGIASAGTGIGQDDDTSTIFD